MNDAQVIAAHRPFGSVLSTSVPLWSRRGVLVALAGAGAVAAVRHRSVAPTPLSPGTVATTFGSVALLAAVPSQRAVHGQAAEHGHGWTSMVDVRVRVTNDLDRSVRLSPGQFRLAVAHTTVTPYAAEPPPGVVAPRASVDVRISYLVPDHTRRLGLVYSDPGRAGRLVQLPVALTPRWSR